MKYTVSVDSGGVVHQVGKEQMTQVQGDERASSRDRASARAEQLG